MDQTPQTVARAAEILMTASPILGSLLVLSLAGNIVLLVMYVRAQKRITDWLMGDREYE